MCSQPSWKAQIYDRDWNLKRFSHPPCRSTKAHPPVLFRPAKPSEATEKLLEEQKEVTDF